MYCHNCGHQIAGDDVCPDCGSPAHNQEPEPNNENLPVPVEEPTEATPDGHRPVKAYDVGGDEDIYPNPRASDLGYVEGADVSVARNLNGDHVMYDGAFDSAFIRCDRETFITNVEGWA